MTADELRTRIDELSARLERLRPRVIGGQGTTGFARKITSQVREHVDHVEPVTSDTIGALRREVAAVFTVLATQHARSCASLAAEALAGDDSTAVEHLCKLMAHARELAASLA